MSTNLGRRLRATSRWDTGGEAGPMLDALIRWSGLAAVATVFSVAACLAVCRSMASPALPSVSAPIAAVGGLAVVALVTLVRLSRTLELDRRESPAFIRPARSQIQSLATHLPHALLTLTAVLFAVALSVPGQPTWSVLGLWTLVTATETWAWRSRFAILHLPSSARRPESFDPSAPPPLTLVSPTPRVSRGREVAPPAPSAAPIDANSPRELNIDSVSTRNIDGIENVESDGDSVAMIDGDSVAVIAGDSVAVIDGDEPLDVDGDDKAAIESVEDFEANARSRAHQSFDRRSGASSEQLAADEAEIAVDEELEPDELCEGDEEQALPAGVIQQWTRGGCAAQGEWIEALTRVEWGLGQRNAVVHLAFCPPLSTMPLVHAHVVEGVSADVTVAEQRPYGARLELRLKQPIAILSDSVVLARAESRAESGVETGAGSRAESGTERSAEAGEE